MLGSGQVRVNGFWQSMARTLDTVHVWSLGVHGVHVGVHFVLSGVHVVHVELIARSNVKMLHVCVPCTLLACPTAAQHLFAPLHLFCDA
jgi:hypothetical protein